MKYILIEIYIMLLENITKNEKYCVYLIYREWKVSSYSMKNCVKSNSYENMGGNCDMRRIIINRANVKNRQKYIIIIIINNTVRERVGKWLSILLENFETSLTRKYIILYNLKK